MSNRCFTQQSLLFTEKSIIEYHITCRKNCLTQSTSGNSYDFMQLSTSLDALQAIYIVTKDSTYLNDEKEIINNIIASSKPSFAIPGNINK